MNMAAVINFRDIPQIHSAIASAARPTPRALARIKTQCSSCNLRELCLPCGMEVGSSVLDELEYTRRRVRRGEALYRACDKFRSLYPIRTGFFKSRVVFEDGRDQVTGFHMAGEVLGMDGIGTEIHAVDTVALEDSDDCIIPYARLEQPDLQRQLHKVMSRELVREQGVMMLLGTMRAEERLAVFLLNLSQRFVARGFSQFEFHLRMTRDEIGSFLGLSLETVSRLFSRFQLAGFVSVQQKHIRIRDIAALKAIINREPV